MKNELFQNNCHVFVVFWCTTFIFLSLRGVDCLGAKTFFDFFFLNCFYVYFVFISWCFLKCYPLYTVVKEWKFSTFLTWQRKNIITCFLTSYMHQVEFFLLIFFNIWPFIYWTLNKWSLETWSCACCYCAYGIFCALACSENISKKHQEIWGGLWTVWCRSQWVK